MMVDGDSFRVYQLSNTPSNNFKSSIKWFEFCPSGITESLTEM